MAEFRMPALGADMEAGTIIQWLVKPGDTVKRGDIIAVVDTEKATIEVEVFDTGIVENIVVPEGQKVPIGAVLAFIRAEGAPVAPPVTKPKTTAPPLAPPAPTLATAPRPAHVPGPQVAKPHLREAPSIVKAPPILKAPFRMRVSPLAMRAALELHVNLENVTGTGPHGAITRSDVERAAKAVRQPTATIAPAAAPAAAKAQRPIPTTMSAVSPEERRASMRKAIAAAMARSKREIPHYYLATEIDMSRAMAWLTAENIKRPVTERILYSVLLLKAVAVAVHEFPEMNGFWIDGVFKPSEAIHIGVAISLHKGGGLIAPAIHDVDKKSLGDIMVNLRDLVKRVRGGVLRSSEIADATITVTSLGEQGVETVFGIIYPPQVALVGFGKIVERPWAASGMVGPRPTITATLAGDHRASDGHRGALFLASLARIFQEPEKL